MLHSVTLEFRNENDQQKLAGALNRNKEMFAKRYAWNCHTEFSGEWSCTVHALTFNTTRKTDIKKVEALVKKLKIKLL